MVRRRKKEERPSSLVNGALAAELRKAYPSLWSFLADEQYDDGGRRETGSLLVFVDAGVLKCCVSDRDAREVAFVTLDGLETLWLVLEEGLGEDTLDWRKSKFGKSRGRGNRALDEGADRT